MHHMRGAVQHARSSNALLLAAAGPAVVTKVTHRHPDRQHGAVQTDNAENLIGLCQKCT